MGIENSKEKIKKFKIPVLVNYTLHGKPKVMSQLVDISQNGLCLNGNSLVSKGLEIRLEIHFPTSCPEITLIEGRISDCEEIIHGNLFHYSILFPPLDGKTKSQIEQFMKWHENHSPENFSEGQTDHRKLKPSVVPPSHHEHRHFERLSVDFKASVYDEISFNMDEGHILDLSKGGMKVSVSEEFNPGDIVTVKLKIGADEIRPHAVIRWTSYILTKNNYEMGLQFQSIHAADLEVIERFIRQQKSAC